MDFLSRRDSGETGMTLRVLDPTNETAPPLGEPAPRLDTLAGKTVGFISNGKEGTKGFFAHLERILRAESAVADVVTRVKSNFSAPADPHGNLQGAPSRAARSPSSGGNAARSLSSDPAAGRHNECNQS